MFGSKKSNSDSLRKLLSTPLFSWPSTSSDKFTIGDATEGVQIFGATGSGKSSGSGQLFIKSFLEKGFGGLVLCAKKTEKDDWIEYAKKYGRYDDVVVFSSDSEYQFNPLFFEQYRDGKGSGETMNMTNLVMILYELGRNFTSGGSSGKDERFWDNSLKRAISRIVDLIKLNPAIPMTFQNMQKILTSAPTLEQAKVYNDLIETLESTDSGATDKNIAINELTQMQKKSLCIDLLVKADVRDDLDKKQKIAYNLTKDYFWNVFANLADRTKSIVVESFLGLVEPFLQGMLQERFSGAVSPEIEPEVCYEENKIIILDFPIKEHLVSGIFAQGIYKFLWMQEMERRVIKDGSKPCFLYIDESQFFLNPEHDQLFQTTARSSLVCSVYLTQNLNNYLFAMGGDSHGDSRAEGLLGNLNTKIFHANGDVKTNEWASRIIGSTYQTKESLQKRGLTPSSANLSEQLLPQILPMEFTTLQRGGQKKNGYKSEAIVFRVGDPWSNGLNHIKTLFSQNL
jgi:hypothetical protein